MARIQPVNVDDLQPSVQVAFERHIKEYNARITNMKSTLGHSLLAFEVYMQWYPLYTQVERILGSRLAYLFAFSISKATDCPLCSAFFRKRIIDAGENPEHLVLSRSEKSLLDFGCSIAQYDGHIANYVYNEVAKDYSPADMVLLLAFAGQMVAASVFNNVVETEIDDYLTDYIPGLKNAGRRR